MPSGLRHGRTTEVLRRWTKLYTGPELVQQYLRDGGAGMVEAQIEGGSIWTLTPIDPTTRLCHPL